MQSLNLIDFPVENLEKIIKILNSTSNVNKSDYLDYFDRSKLINKLYPYQLIIKKDDLKLYNDLLKKFNLSVGSREQNELDYKLISVETKAPNEKELKFNINKVMSLKLE